MLQIRSCSSLISLSAFLCLLCLYQPSFLGSLHWLDLLWIQKLFLMPSHLFLDSRSQRWLTGRPPDYPARFFALALCTSHDHVHLLCCSSSLEFKLHQVDSVCEAPGPHELLSIIVWDWHRVPVGTVPTLVMPSLIGPGLPMLDRCSTTELHL